MHNVLGESDLGHMFRRFVFDVVWWLLITLLLVNMVAGIIIDSFAQIREEENRVRAQLSTKCFICEVRAAHGQEG